MSSERDELRRQLDETQAIAHIGSWTWEAATDRVTFSDELYRIYGLEPQSRHVDLEAYLELIDPEYRDEMLSAVRNSSWTGEPFLVLHRITHPDGSKRWIEGQGRAFLVEGRPHRMVGTCLDVTERERYEESLRETLAEVRASRTRIVEAADRERRRVERDLHDGAQQRLLSLSMSLRLARARTPDGADHEDLRSILDGAAEDVRAAIEELRDLARGIHSALLTGRGLRPALESLVERSPLPATVIACPEDRFGMATEVAVYYVVSESLANAIKHAGASHVSVSVRARNGSLTVAVEDDGTGGARVDRGGGLRGLADRIAVLDGRFDVRSPEGGGTTIVAEMPCG
jgi:PAS domain S-box-containing protein